MAHTFSGSHTFVAANNCENLIDGLTIWPMFERMCQNDVRSCVKYEPRIRSFALKCEIRFALRPAMLCACRPTTYRYVIAIVFALCVCVCVFMFVRVDGHFRPGVLDKWFFSPPIDSRQCCVPVRDQCPLRQFEPHEQQTYTWTDVHAFGATAFT